MHWGYHIGCVAVAAMLVACNCRKPTLLMTAHHEWHERTIREQIPGLWTGCIAMQRCEHARELW